jgi:membrane protease YdiL (CAAX protease family)
MTQPFDYEPVDPVPVQAWPEAGPPVAAEVEPQPEPRPRFRPVALCLALAAWGVVGVLAIGAVVRSHLDALQAAEPTSPANDIHIYLLRMQARYSVGTKALFAGTSSVSVGQIYEQAKSMFAGSINQRLRFVVLAGELGGPEEALAYLKKLDELLAKTGTSYTQEQKLQRDTLWKLYHDYARLRYDAPSVPEVERQQLRDQMDWFGDLALAPAGQPGAGTAIVAQAGIAPAALIDIRDECPAPALRETILYQAKVLTILVWVIVVGVILLAFVGFIGLVAFAILGFVGVLRHGVTTGKSPAGVYIETFALWMGAFAVLAFGLSYVTPHVELGDYRLLVGGVVELATLLVIFWPVVRGVPLRQVLQDIGLTRGRQPALEPAAGVACYVMSLPVLILAVIVVALLTALWTWLQTELGGGPSPDDLRSPISPDHPITLPLARGSWSIRLQIFFLASIVAPIVEETMFRGVLYRHLRELTSWAGSVLSILFGALVSSFIFAVIHPQGLLAVPMLMALAMGFVLAREWRGTLIPGMVGHGINNGLVLLFGIVTLG